MVYYPIDDYELIKFERSTHKNKKYDAYIKKKGTDKIVTVPFGDTRYQQYEDRIGLYSDLDHHDESRRDNYHSRQMGYLRDGYFSPGYFSMYYLW